MVLFRLSFTALYIISDFVPFRSVKILVLAVGTKQKEKFLHAQRLLNEVTMCSKRFSRFCTEWPVRVFSCFYFGQTEYFEQDQGLLWCGFYRDSWHLTHALRGYARKNSFAGLERVPVQTFARPKWVAVLRWCFDTPKRNLFATGDCGTLVRFTQRGTRSLACLSVWINFHSYD